MVPFIGNSQVFINFKECHSYMVYNNKVLLNVDDSLSCLKHEEADTKIIYHICNVDAKANFVIRCSDNDIATIQCWDICII